MANIIGINGNDTLLGTNSADTINGNGNGGILIYQDNDLLTGGGGKDKFIYNLNYLSSRNTDTITDFGGVGKGVIPSAAVIAEVDTIQFQGYNLTVQNLLLTQNGSNLEITFEGVDNRKVILKNFKLENLDNLPATFSRPAIGNILFDGQTSITDSFDVFDANSTQTNLFNKNTVTFLNDLNNNITGLDNSNDVVNGQRGNDKIDGKSGNDLLRGGTGNDTLIGGEGDDSLIGGEGDDTLNGGIGNDSLYGGTGNDLLWGGAGNDNLFGGTEKDTLLGGTGDDRLTIGYLNLDSLGGNQLLCGDDGNDTLSASGYQEPRGDGNIYYVSGNNTLNGGAGDDYLIVNVSKGNNLLNGGDGNDTFSKNYSGNDTIDGGNGDDLLSYDTQYFSYYVTGGITSTFNPTTNIGSITLGTNRVSYKNIERLEITGTSYDDLIVGSNGNDTLGANLSPGGNDTLDGGIGDDLLLVDNTSRGITSADGGIGDDVLSVDHSSATGGITTTFNPTTNIVTITAGTNRVSYKNIERLDIRGTFYDDNIVGNNGNDTLNPGNFGNDTIDGGIGDDLLRFDGAREGITTKFNTTTNVGSITAGTRLVSYKNIERLNISGTDYDDLIVGSNGNDTLAPGQFGNDTIDGGTGDDLLSYTRFDPGEAITSSFDATTNTGLITLSRDRVSYKNIERLNISSTSYDDNIVGSNGNDKIIGNYTYALSFDAPLGEAISGNDTIDGGKGDDLLIVHDTYGAEGITSTFNAITNQGSITAGINQVIYKNIERLDIIGSFYDDLIVGVNGDDSLNGNGGNDTLIGGKGNDSLIGGSGTDTFAFNSFNEGIDRLDDFNITNELIRVSVAGFGGGLSPGSLETSQFIIGASATTSTQRFIYNDVTGALYFDQDGSAIAFTQVEFGQLSAGLSLTKNNFVVV
ncbi:MAG: calcium-binding protein [Nostoc sp.]